MPNPIPTSSRVTVRKRDLGMCVRCGVPGTDWHHRRSRRVRDNHTHCACVGVSLDRSCHEWVHRNPSDAEALGFIVSQFEDRPWTVPVRTYSGWAEMQCDGTVEWVRGV